jgi:hypothetical protein
MNHRIFTDSNGTDWLVLAVYPSSEERRSHDDRRSGEHVLSPEPRRKTQRRQAVRRSMQKGWLVFKADGARRRFTPIIDNWDTCPVAELEKLLGLAIAARRTGDKPRAG